MITHGTAREVVVIKSSWLAWRIALVWLMLKYYVMPWQVIKAWKESGDITWRDYWNDGVSPDFAMTEVLTAML